MFGIRFIKSQPTTHRMPFRGGKLAREGAGLSFFCFAPATTLVAVSVASHDRHFMPGLVAADFLRFTAGMEGAVSMSETQGCLVL